MKLPWTSRRRARRARLNMQQLDRAVDHLDHLSDIFNVLEDIRGELRSLNEQLADVPAGQLAAIAAMARTSPPAGAARDGGNTAEWHGHRFDGTDCPCMDPRPGPRTPAAREPLGSIFADLDRPGREDSR